MRLAIIPARSGSKRIQNKNIKSFHGKPILHWVVDEIKKSNCFDKIIISTDNKKISELASKMNVETPFLRPKNLSDDKTPIIPVIRHAINWYKNKKIFFNEVCCVYATAVFLKSKYLIKGLKYLNQTNVHFTLSACKFNYPIQRAFKLNKEKRIEMFQPEYFLTRSQDLEDAWHDAGQFCWGKSNAWLRDDILFSNKTIPIEIPNFRVQDIDTIADWKRAELMFSILKRENI